jgi:hypothetical protein
MRGYCTVKMKTSLSATGITRCSAWVHLGINYTGIKYQQEYITLSTVGTSYITRAKHGTSLFWNLKNIN